MITRRAFCGGLAALAACGGRATAATRGAAFLVARQAADGSFPSRTYGFMSGGASLTPFAGLALRGTDAAAKAAAWCAGKLDGDGALGLVGIQPDYPVYATALAVRLWIAVGGYTTEVARACAWLEGQQLREGWEGLAAHGGFPMGSRNRPSPGTDLHVDLSMTRRAIEALVEAGREGPTIEAARGFVKRCASRGGFVYSPVQPALNKGACTDEACTPYGSATCDGTLALLALGEDAAVPLAWLRTNHGVDANPGVASPDFARAMRGYYRAASAEVFARVGGPDGWREALRAAIEADQHADGGWANEITLQKEDDPIIATGFALLALASL